MEMMDSPDQEQSSFGIKKIVDVKLSAEGKQMYKVQWEPTWEPVENLASCQHLIDDFWSFVNKAKINEENVMQPKQHVQGLDMNAYINMASKIPKMSEDDKSDVQRLIARTNQTLAGNSTLMSPNMLLDQQNQHMAGMHQKPIIGGQHSQDQKPINFNLPDQKSKVSAIVPKADPSFSPSAGGGKEKVSNNASLKYVENFENPYVKIILVCKICNKEQSLKFSHTWKRHYLSHASTEDKPHKCPCCPKAFITLTQKKKHLKTHEKAMMHQNIKEEQMNQMY